MTIFKYSLKRGFFSPATLILNCAMPLALMIAMRGEGLGEQGLFLIAMAVMFGGFFMAKGVQSDRAEGVLMRILAGPVTMADYLIQNLLSAIIPMIGLSAAIGVFGIAFHDWNLTFALGVSVAYSFLAITSVGLSFVWSSLFKSKDSSSAAFAAAMTLIAAVSGFFVPLRLMPDILFYIGALFPAHWASRAIQIMLDYGEFTQMYWLSILAMLLFAVAYILFGGKRRII
ncbi:MAG: ABC transporter permease [Defluviitaleaceae bacterium]|nr:ABC transporter permease [Defluviitaleaceae bacterium]